MTEESAPSRVEVLWRPGCPFCVRLRRGLRRAGIRTTERDIWADPAAAERVRGITGGDETVPTVVVGSRELVNPRVAEVRAALRAEYPDDEPTPDPPVWRGVAFWTVLVLLVWTVLVVWRPGTTWHLAPLLLGAAAPWTAGQDVGAGESRGALRVLVASLAGVLVTGAAVAVFAAAGLLRGPALGPFAGPVVESAVLGAAGAVLATASGLRRARRRPQWRSARVGDHEIASSDDVVVVDGAPYFRLDDVAPDVLARTATRTVCPWKGVASYYDVAAGGAVLRDAAWAYHRPSPLARRVKGRVAFDRRIELGGR